MKSNKEKQGNAQNAELLFIKDPIIRPFESEKPEKEDYLKAGFSLFEMCKKRSQGILSKEVSSMLKIVVAEDEETIRYGIVTSIQEKDQGEHFEVVAECEDGEEALEKIMKLQPDIIITDIKMPFMDGLTLLEKLNIRESEMFAIILSGHDEFDYARRAIQAGAFDYLLKPIQVKQLMQVLYAIKDKIEENNRKKADLKRLKRIEKESADKVKRNYLRNLIEGRAKEEESISGGLKEGRFYTAGIVNFENIALISAGCDYLEFSELGTKFETTLQKVTRIYPGVTILKDKPWEYAICIETGTKRETDQILENIKSELQRIRSPKMILYAIFGSTYTSPSKLQNSYQEARHLREKRSLNFEELLTGQDQTNKEKVQYMDFDDSALISAVRAGDLKAIDAELEKMELKMKEQKILSQLHMAMVGARVYSDISKLLEEISYNIEDILMSNLEYFNGIISQTTPAAMVEKLKEYSYNISHFLGEACDGRFDKVLRKAKEFIKNNYMNSNLMLEDVAKYLFISVAYLCIIFKKETGETFIEYLTRVRMEEAARLLKETDMRNYEIAEAVGYSNATYFSTVFKKYYQISPSNYRYQYRKTKES